MSQPPPPPIPLPWHNLARSALLLGGLAAAGLALNALSDALGTGTLGTGVLERFVTGQGPAGQALFVLVTAAACAAGIPRQAASFAAGYAFGLWPGIPLVLAGLVLACAANFLWARLIARDWTRRHILPRFGGRLSRIDAFLTAHPFSTTLTLRLLPVGSNLAFNLLAGVSAMRVIPFLVGSALGYVPQTVIFALLGSGIGVADWLRVAISAALFVASILIGLILLRRHRATAGAISESA